MRLSKVFWIILGVGVFIIAFVALYMLYSRQLSDQAQVNSKLDLAKATLPRLVTEKQSWNSQLTQLQSQLSEANTNLTQAKTALDKSRTGILASAESIEYDEKLFQIADAWNLDIIRVTASEPVAKDMGGGIIFSVTTFTLQVQGRAPEAAFASPDDYRVFVYGIVDDILAFVDQIVKDRNFATATIDPVSMNVPKPLTQEEVVAQDVGVDRPSAVITLNLYTYKGG